MGSCRPTWCWWVLPVLAMLVSRSDATERVAITFDDLPLNGELAPGTTRAGLATEVLDLLRQQGAPPVVGFVNGGRASGIEDGEEALRRWVAGGGLLGNHTYSHLSLSEHPASEFLADVARNEPVLRRFAPQAGPRWFRYPYLREGDTLAKRRAVRAALRSGGERIAEVTLDYEDYLWNTPYARCKARGDADAMAWLRSSYLAVAASYLDANRRAASVVFARPIRHVLLLHLGAFSPVILPDLLELLRTKGFELTTLADAERDPAYRSDPDVASAQGGTLLELWLAKRAIPVTDAPEKPYAALEAICR